MDVVSKTVAWLTDPAHWTGPTGIPTRLLEHVAISAVSLLIALAIALPIGLYIGHTRRHTPFPGNSANLWRGLALLAALGGEPRQPVAGIAVARGDRDRPPDNGEDRSERGLQDLPDGRRDGRSRRAAD